MGLGDKEYVSRETPLEINKSSAGKKARVWSQSNGYANSPTFNYHVVRVWGVRNSAHLVNHARSDNKPHPVSLFLFAF